MSLLVSDKTFFKTYNVANFPVTVVYTDKLELSVEQAKDFYVKPALGQALWNDILAYSGSPFDANYDVLINGGDFTYGGITYNCVGLNKCICFYAYGLYSIDGDIVETKFGSVVKKETEVSDRISNDQRNTKINKNKGMGLECLNNVLQYLNLNSTLFPNYALKNTSEIRQSINIYGN